MKSFYILAAALMSPILVSAGCQCEASNEACTQSCGKGMITCLYGCEANDTDECVNACLDTYWPIIGTQEDINAKLPFVKRSEDPLVVTPSDFQGEREHESHGGHKKDNWDSHGSGSHGEPKKDFPEKGKSLVISPDLLIVFFILEKGPEEKHLPLPPVIEVPREENHHPTEIHDDYKKGGKEGFGRNSASGLHPFASVSVLALALTGAFLIAV